jgi:hypothetical protein
MQQQKRALLLMQLLLQPAMTISQTEVQQQMLRDIPRSLTLLLLQMLLLVSRAGAAGSAASQGV